MLESVVLSNTLDILRAVKKTSILPQEVYNNLICYMKCYRYRSSEEYAAMVMNRNFDPKEILFEYDIQEITRDFKEKYESMYNLSINKNER